MTWIIVIGLVALYIIEKRFKKLEEKVEDLEDRLDNKN